MKYVNPEKTIIDDDGKSIPVDLANRDYRKIVEDGTIIDPYVAPVLSRGDQIAKDLATSEKPDITARKLEDLILALEAGDPVPQSSVAWANNRVTERNKTRS